jgi:hypothetical protein
MFPDRNDLQANDQIEEVDLYKGGPILDLALDWGAGRWVGGRLRLSPFLLDRGGGLNGSGPPVRARSYGFDAVFEARIHLCDPGRPGPYVVVGGGTLRMHYDIQGLGNDALAKGGLVGGTWTTGLGMGLKGGWEVEARWEDHATGWVGVVIADAIFDAREADPTPSGAILVVRKRF